MLAAALVASTPVIATTQAGTGLSDAAALALLVTAVALLVNSDEHPAAVGVAAVAAGLGLGTKLTGVAAIVVISLALIVLRRT